MLDLLLAALAGAAAGFINAVVGSGTLLSFPVLLALGLPPVSANITNNLGLVPGSFAGAWGYRRELRGQRRRVAVLVPASVVGGVTGALLLLVLPESVFAAVVPALIGLALVLVLLQPRLQGWVRRSRGRAAAARGTTTVHHDHLAAAVPVTALTGVYGGYFGAAQGVLLIGALGAVVDDDVQRINALKNVLAGVVNLVAAVVFVVVAPQEVVWPLVGAVAAGALLGGLVGGRVGRRLPPLVLRGVIVVVGVVAIVALVLP
ncbi:sulfite exporter TauE/SafE family protein [Aquipuribacter nitratireducens]|uniref:Probable membrane transporter protein n=1 Tax=Aquipuribacter nitratireducens TaxID=650104 RepID=A0ABW0GKL2_9MICO